MAPSPPEHGQCGGRGYFLQQSVCGGEGRAEKTFGASEVEIGFVNRSHFNDRGILSQNLGDAIAPLSVKLVMAVEKNRVRAQFRRGAQRHRRMHAESARFVARGSDHTALVALPADDYRLAAQFGTREEFDRNEKRVHINVQDRSGGIRGGGQRGVMLRAILCQLGHGKTELKSERAGSGNHCLATASARARRPELAGCLPNPW